MKKYLLILGLGSLMACKYENEQSEKLTKDLELLEEIFEEKCHDLRAALEPQKHLKGSKELLELYDDFYDSHYIFLENINSREASVNYKKLLLELSGRIKTHKNSTHFVDLIFNDDGIENLHMKQRNILFQSIELLDKMEYAVTHNRIHFYTAYISDLKFKDIDENDSLEVSFDISGLPVYKYEVSIAGRPVLFNDGFKRRIHKSELGETWAKVIIHSLNGSNVLEQKIEKYD